jgi:Fic family protein
MYSQLDNIRQTLKSIEQTSRDPDLLEALREVKANNEESCFNASIWDIHNYRAASHTLKMFDTGNYNFNNLVKASNWLTDKNDIKTIDLIIHLNQIITGNKHSNFRHERMTGNYSFPDPEHFEKGLSLINESLQAEFEVPFIHKVAIAQALISLHPFSDGNHRTTRMLLEFWLMKMQLPTLRLKKQSDFFIANPHNNFFFTLHHAAALSLLAMQERLIAGSGGIGKSRVRPGKVSGV